MVQLLAFYLMQEDGRSIKFPKAPPKIKAMATGSTTIFLGIRINQNTKSTELWCSF
jgi:hypothetical protein